MPNTPMIMRGRMMLRAIACADRDESELLDCSVGLVDELVVSDEEWGVIDSPEIDGDGLGVSVGMAVPVGIPVAAPVLDMVWLAKNFWYSSLVLHKSVEQHNIFLLSIPRVRRMQGSLLSNRVLKQRYTTEPPISGPAIHPPNSPSFSPHSSVPFTHPIILLIEQKHTIPTAKEITPRSSYGKDN